MFSKMLLWHNYCLYRKDFNIEVLKKFIALHDFKGKLLVDAIRYSISSKVILVIYMYYLQSFFG